MFRTVSFKCVCVYVVNSFFWVCRLARCTEGLWGLFKNLACKPVSMFCLNAQKWKTVIWWGKSKVVRCLLNFPIRSSNCKVQAWTETILSLHLSLVGSCRLLSVSSLELLHQWRCNVQQSSHELLIICPVTSGNFHTATITEACSSAHSVLRLMIWGIRTRIWVLSAHLLPRSRLTLVHISSSPSTEAGYICFEYRIKGGWS